MKKFPNVILIVLDTLRARNMSLYGYPKRTTPFLEEIAAKSVVFRNAYAAAPWTLPSHASIFTGLYPSRHNANKKGHYLKENILTMAEYLKNKGYSTTSFSANPWIDDRTKMLRGFDKKYRFWQRIDHRNSVMPRMIRAVINRLAYRLRGVIFDKGAIRINRKISDELTNQCEPFFYFINFMETHAPYLPPVQHKIRFSRNISRIDLFRISRISAREYDYVFGDRAFPTIDKLEILENLYNEEIAYLDDRLRELWNVFRSKKLLENTLIFITSDHGDNIGDHHLLNHELSLYDNLLKVPLMVFSPSFFIPTLREEKVENRQIFSTLIREIFNENPEKFIDSNHALSLFSNEKSEYVYAEEVVIPVKKDKLLKKLKCPIYKNEFMLHNRLKAIFWGEYKYIFSSLGRHELFDLHEDSGETKNLFHKPKYSELAGKMEKKILETLKGFSLEEDVVEVTDAETNEQLKGLGYL